MSAGAALSITTPTDREIVLTRTFNAPAGLVFDTLTMPHLLTRWYGARGWHLVRCDVDLREGGSWRFVSRGPDGAEMGQGGVYREIVRPQRLVYTEVFDDQSYPGETLITQVLADNGSSTLLTCTVRYASREARDVVLRYPMARGVGQAYHRLDDVLTELLHQEHHHKEHHEEYEDGETL